MVSSTAAAAAMAAANQPLRVVSRRAQQFLQRYRQQQGGKSSQGTNKTSSKKENEASTPWPKSLRYTFYTICAVSVPLSICQMIASSPKIRESMLGDDIEDATLSPSYSGNVTTLKGIISLVRNYWGDEDYTAPVDRLQMKHIIPGYRKLWQEDNYSSLLQLFGLYTPPNNTDTSGDVVSTTTTKEDDEEGVVPISLENEPPYNIRYDQSILSYYLSTKYNPAGVKTRLTLFPCTQNNSDGSSMVVDDANIDDTAGYDTTCILPGNLTMSTLRQYCLGSDAQCIRRDLAESDPTFNFKATSERLRTTCWNKDCHWVVNFPEDDMKGEDSFGNDVDDNNDEVANIFVLSDDGTSLDSQGRNKTSEDAAKELRHLTSIHASWTYFPESSSNTSSTSPTAMGSAATSSGNVVSASTSTSADSLQVQRLEHQIATLENELKSSSSMRDRDDMYGELKKAKREMRALKPWYRRVF